jgi:hypothetical protein
MSFDIYIYAPGVRRQRGRPLSSVLGSQVNRLSSMHVSCSPPASHISNIPSLYYCVFGRTVVNTIRYTSTALSVDVANILLQARSRDTASALRNRTVRIGTSSEGRDGEDDGGGCELHFRIPGVVWRCWNEDQVLSSIDRSSGRKNRMWK